MCDIIHGASFDRKSILPKGEECSIVLSIIHVLCRKGILLQLNGYIVLVSFFKTNIGALKITLTGAGGSGDSIAPLLMFMCNSRLS